MRDLSLGKHLTLSFVVSSMLFNSALALPSGGAFTNGTKGSITTNGNTMNITGTTSSGKHVITWGGGFNIERGETVNFTTDKHYYLNLDYSKNSSKLYGTLNGGTNNIFLVNPNGTVIGGGAVINANKFAVSTKALSDTQIQEFTLTGKFSPVFEPSVAGDIDIQKGSDIKVSELTLVGDKIVFAGGVNAAEGMRTDTIKVTSNAIEVNSGANINSKTIDFSASTLISFNGGLLSATTLNATAGTKSNLNSNQKGQINLSSSSDLDIEGKLTLTADNIQGSANIKANSLTFSADDAINLTGGTITASAQSLSSNWINIDSTTLSGANITLKGTGTNSVAELNGATITSTGLDIDAYQVELNKKGSKDTTISATNGVDIDATNQIAVDGATFNDSNLNLQATNKIDIKDTNFNIEGKTLTLTSEKGIINIADTTSQKAVSATLKADDINFNSGAILSADTLNIDASNNAIFNGSTITAYHDATFNGDYIGAENANFTFGRTANPAEFFANNISFKNSTFIGTNGKSGIALDADNAIELEGNTFQNLTQLNAEANQITWKSGTIANSVDNAYFHAKENQLLINGGTLNAANMTLSADKYLNISGGTFSNTTLNLLGKNLIDLTGGSLSANSINIDKVEDSDTLTVNFTNGTINADSSLSADASKIVVGSTLENANSNPSLTASNLTLSADQIAVESGTIKATSNGTLSAVDKIDLKGGAINGGHLRFETTSKDYNAEDPKTGGVINFDGSTITSDAEDIDDYKAIEINADQINFNKGTLTATKGSINANAKHKIVVNGSEFEVTKDNDLVLNGEKEVEIKKDFGDNFNGDATITTDEKEGNIDISLEEGETLKGDNLEFVSAYLDLKRGTIVADKILKFEAYNKLNLGKDSTANLRAATMDLITHNVMNIEGGTLNSTILNLKGINDDKTATGENEGVAIDISGGTLASVGTLNTSGADQLNFNSDTNWQADMMNINSKRVVLNGAILASADLNFGTSGGGTEYIDIKSGTLTADNALKLYATNLITLSDGILKGASVNLAATTNSSTMGVIDLQGGTIEATNNDDTITVNASQITSQNGSTSSGTEFKASTLNLDATNNLRIKGGNFSAVTDINFKGKAGIEFSGGTFGDTSDFILSSDGLVDISRTGELKATKFTINGYNGSDNAGGINFKNMNLTATDNIAFNATKQLIIESGKLESSKDITLSGLGSLQISGDSTSIKGANVNLNSNNWISITDASLEATSGTLSIQAKADTQATDTGKVIDILGSANLKASSGTIDIDAQEINIGTADQTDSSLSLDAQTIDLNANNQVNINGGTITATASAKNDSNPDLSIWGGQSINISDDAALNATNGLLKLNTFNKINIAGGTLQANQLVLKAKPNGNDITSGGLIEISGGTLENSGDTFTLEANQINTSGGTLNANSNLDFTAANKIVINGGTFNVKNGTFTLDGEKQLDFKQGTFDFGSDGNLKLTSASDGQINYTHTNSLNVKDLTINGGEINLENANITASGTFGFDASQWIRINSSTLTASGNADITAKSMEFSGGSFKASTITLNTGGLLNIKDKASLEATNGALTINEKEGSGNSELNLDNGSSLKVSSDIKIDTDEINIKGALNAANITLGDTNAQNINITDGANIDAISALALKAIKSILISGTSTHLEGATIEFTNSGYTHITDGSISAASSITFTQNGDANLLRIEGGTISTGNSDTSKSGSITFTGEQANVQIYGGTFTTNEFKADNVKQFIVGNTANAPTIIVTELNLNASDNLAIANGDIIDATTATLQSANLINITGGTLTLTGELKISGDKKVNITGGTINAQNIDFITKNYIYLGGTADITATENIDFVANNGTESTVSGTVEFAGKAQITANTITIGDENANSSERVEQIIFNGGTVQTSGDNDSLKGYAKQIYVKDGTLKSSDLYLEGAEKISLTGGTIDNGGQFIEFVSGKIIELGIALESAGDIKLTAPQLNIVKGADINAGNNLTLVSTGENSDGLKGGLYLGGGELTAGNTLTLVGENGIAMMDDYSDLTITANIINLLSNNYINISGSITGQNITLSGFTTSANGDETTYTSATGEDTVIDLANVDISGKEGENTDNTLTIDGKQINLSGSKTISNFKTANFTASNQIKLEGGTLSDIDELNLQSDEGEVLVNGATIANSVEKANLKSNNHIALNSGTIEAQSLNLSGASDETKPKVIDFGGATVNANSGTLTANAGQINVSDGSLNAANVDFDATKIVVNGGSITATDIDFTITTGEDSNKGGIDISGGKMNATGTLNLSATDSVVQVSNDASLTANEMNLKAYYINIAGGSFHGITDGTNTLKLLSDNLVQISGGTFDIKNTIIDGITTQAENEVTNNSSLKELIISGGTFNKNLNAYAENINFKNGNTVTFTDTGTIGATSNFNASNMIKFDSASISSDNNDLTFNAKDIALNSGAFTSTNAANLAFDATNSINVNGTTFTNSANNSTLKFDSDNYLGLSGNISGFGTISAISGEDLELDGAIINTRTLDLSSTGNTVIKNSSRLTTSSSLNINAVDLGVTNSSITVNGSGTNIIKATGNLIFDGSSLALNGGTNTINAIKDMQFNSSTITNGSASTISATGDLVFDGSTFNASSGSTNSFDANNILLNNSSLNFNSAGATFTADGTFQSTNSSMILISGVTVNANANDIIISGAKGDGDSIELRGGSTINLTANDALKIENAKFYQINATGSNSNKYNFEAANRISVDGAEFYGYGSNSKLAVSFKTTADNGSIDLTSVDNTVAHAVGGNALTIDSNLVEFKGGNNLTYVSTETNTDFIDFSGTNNTITNSTLTANDKIDFASESSSTLSNSTLDATKLINVAGAVSLSGTTFKSSGNIESNSATINLSGTNNFYAAYQKYTGTSFSGSGSTLNFKGYDGSAATKIEFQTGTNFSNISTINANATGILVNTGTGSNQGFGSGIDTIDFDASNDLQVKTSNLSATNVNLDSAYLYISGAKLGGQNLKLNTTATASGNGAPYLKVENSSFTNYATLTMGKDSTSNSVIDISGSTLQSSSDKTSIYADVINLTGGNTFAFKTTNNIIKALTKLSISGSNTFGGGTTIDGGKEISISNAQIESSGEDAKLWLRTTSAMDNSKENGIVTIQNSTIGNTGTKFNTFYITDSEGNNAGTNDIIINSSSIYANDSRLNAANKIDVKSGSRLDVGSLIAKAVNNVNIYNSVLTISNAGSGAGIFANYIDFYNGSTFSLTGGTFDIGDENTKYVRVQAAGKNGAGVTENTFWVNGSTAATLTFEGEKIDFKGQLTTNNAAQTINFKSKGDINFDGADFTVNGGTTTIGIGTTDTKNITFKDSASGTNSTFTNSGTLNLTLQAKNTNSSDGKIDLSGLTANISSLTANANEITIANGASITASGTIDLSSPGNMIMTGGTVTADTFKTSSGANTGKVFLQGGNLNANTITLGGKEVQILASDKQNKGTTIHGKNGSSNATTVTVDANTVGYINASSVYANTINNQNASGWTSMNIDDLVSRGGNGPEMTGSAKSYLNIATNSTATQNASQWYQFVEWFNAGTNGVNSYDQYNLLNDINFNWANLAASNTYGLINNFTNQTFNGNGHTLYYFNIGKDGNSYSNGTYAGLIQNATNSTFQNVVIDGAWMNLSGNTIQYAGILVGNAANNSVFDNIKFKDNIGITANISKSGGAIYVGGVVGKVSAGSSFTNIDVNNAQINATNTYGSDTGWAYAGGLAGMITEGAIVDKIYMNNITVNAITKGNNSRAFAGGFSGVMQNNNSGTVAVSNVVMNGISVKAQAPEVNAGTGVNPSFAGAFTNVSLEDNLNAKFENIFIYLKSLSAKGSFGSLRSFFVGAYNSDDSSNVTSTNVHIYTSESYKTITLQGRDSQWLAYSDTTGKAFLHREESTTTNWENMVTKQYNWTASSQGFYDISKIQGTATPSDKNVITSESTSVSWSNGSSKTNVNTELEGEEKEETKYQDNTAGDANQNNAELADDISKDNITVNVDKNTGNYVNGGTIANLGDDIEYNDEIASADEKGYDDLEDSLTNIVDSGIDEVASITPPTIGDITGDSEDTINGANDSTATTDSDINYDTDLAGDKANMGDESGFADNNKQPGDIEGNENGNGGNEGGEGGNDGADDLDPSGNDDITNTGKGDEITISDSDKAASNNANKAGNLIDKTFNGVTYTDKDYNFNSGDYSADILSEILAKITNGYYVLDVEDFKAAYEAAQKGDISGFLEILQVSDAEKAETIRQAMDFMKEFYGSNGLGETIYTSGGDEFKTYNEKAHNLKESKGDLWEFIYGNGKFDDKVENFFKDYEQYVEYKEQLKDLNTKYNEFKAYMDGLNLDENSETYKEMSAKLEEIQEQYNTLKDKADAFIDETMKPQQGYIQGVFDTTASKSNDHFKFADDSGRIYDDFDYTKDFGGEEVPPMPDQQPDTPETPNIDPKMFTDITDQADVLETDDKENEIDEAAGEDRQRLCVVSDNAKTMNPCLAPK